MDLIGVSSELDSSTVDADEWINDQKKLLWLGQQDMQVIMDVLALPDYLANPKFEDLNRQKFDYYF